MIDTHAHLEACAGPVGAVLERARTAGVERVVTVGTGIDSSRTALRLADEEAGVYAALGIHPHDADTEDARRLDELRELLAHERAVAVGETGLDHHRDYAPRAAQLCLFEEQLALAGEVGLPVIIHSRAAARDTADALGNFDGNVVLHCFSEPELLDVALERGYYVSFAGNATHPKAAAFAMLLGKSRPTGFFSRPTARSSPRSRCEGGRTSRRTSSTLSMLLQTSAAPAAASWRRQSTPTPTGCLLFDEQ